MKSMTAYASTSQAFQSGHIRWEIRSVNHRYLDIQFRMSEKFKALEPLFRETIKSHVSRGKIEAALTIETNELEVDWEIDTQQLHRLHHAVQTIQGVFPKATSLNPIEILMLPGIQQPPSQLDLTNEALSKSTIETLTLSLEQLNATRAREGQNLQQFLAEKLQRMLSEITKVEQTFPTIFQKHTDKLKQRIAQVSDSLDENRWAQEVVYLAQKADINEELERLKTHLKEVNRLIHQDGVMGRRLDFLMQELNREANTLGSKSMDSLLSQASVELKVLIEQMREQIQNIE